MKSKKLKIALIIFIVLIILILCFSAGVYASYLLAATEVNYTKPDGTTVGVKEALDELRAKEKINDTKKELGDEVTVAGEKFYVLEWLSGSNVATLFSKYTLNKAGTEQQETIDDTAGCAFASTNYWLSSIEQETDSDDTPFNLNNIEGYKDTDALGKAKSYGMIKGAIEGRLLSLEEANYLRIIGKSDSKINSMFKSNKQAYWLGSSDRKEQVWRVDPDNSFRSIMAVFITT